MRELWASQVGATLRVGCAAASCGQHALLKHELRWLWADTAAVVLEPCNLSVYRGEGKLSRDLDRPV
jgi:hypothetical protein